MSSSASGEPFTEVYTDGACSGNPGPGGWAWVVRDGPHGSGAEAHTTNQRMEVHAVLEAIRANEAPIHIFSDSTYVVNCFRDKWHEGWIKRGWKNSQRKPVANRDLWEPLIEAALPRLEDGSLKFSWVKGHSGNEMNELADQLAVAARDDLRSLDGAPVVSLDPEPDSGSAPDAAHGDAVPWSIGPALLVVGTTTPTADQILAVEQAVASLSAEAVVVTGLRRGVELLAAEAAIERRIAVAAVLPFTDPAAGWDDGLRSRFDEAFGRAAYDIVLDGDPAAPGNAVSLRNRWFERAALGALIVGDDELAERYVAAGLSVITA